MKSEKFEMDKIDLNEVIICGGDRKTKYSSCDGDTGEDIYDSETNTLIYINC